MQTSASLRFDPNFAAEMLVDIAQEQSLGNLLNKLVGHAVERTDIACAQVWLIERGDRCNACPHKPECLDQSRCFHLIVGKGDSIVESGKKLHSFEDINMRVPVEASALGQAISKGHQVFLRDLESEPPLPEFNWLKQERIRGIVVTPIIFKGETLGAMVALSRMVLPDQARPWGRIFADHVGAAIANVRAFEEIQRLKAQLVLQNTYLQEEVVEAKAFGDLVGQSEALRQIISQIDLVAPTEASVLILGETGTGKELVAIEIHRRSRRKDGPFVRVNCASIPRELFESEFFGHVRGAYTGAVKDRAGRFETAEGGTILLDEVGEVPLDMQNKLLRVLQEKRYERVGDDRTRIADVRVIAATNRDLKKAVAAGRFREDLYYRLHVFPIQVTPLRERLDDIPLLANHFVDLSVRDMKCKKPRITRAGIIKLQNYDWPGNVRELRNVIERAVILARGGALDFDLPANVSSTAPHPATKVAKSSEAVSPAKPKILTELEMEKLERENLLAALITTNWKIKGRDGAAELLGIKPTTLLTRVKRWGIKRS